MKRISIICALSLISLFAGAQTVNIHMKSGEVKVFNSTYVDYVNFTPAPEAIDLGLPSGTKWANMNIGATAPEDYGYYFAWGETIQRDEIDFYWPTYTYYDPNSTDMCIDIGQNISGTQYDAATVNWGETWCMPTAEQFQELSDNCSTAVVTINDVTGMMFIGPNGNSIFLPNCGVGMFTDIMGEGFSGYYWASTLQPWGTAQNLFFNTNIGDNGFSMVDGQERCAGLTIRPVSK